MTFYDAEPHSYGRASFLGDIECSIYDNLHGSPSPIVQPADGVESADSCVPDFQMTSVENNEQVGRGEPKFRKLHFL
jgi:hypothetical protein